MKEHIKTISHALAYIATAIVLLIVALFPMWVVATFYIMLTRVLLF